METISTVEANVVSLGVISAPLSIRVVHDQADKEAIYRFRYSVYVQEMHRNVSAADHTYKVFSDHLDEEDCVLIGVFRGHTVVGTCAINFSTKHPINYCREIYDLAHFERFFPGKIALFTKLMLAPECRGSSTLLRMMKFMYKVVLERGAEINLLDCNPHLVDVFCRVGFRMYKEKGFHKDYGWVTPLAFLNHDMKYLRSIQSPVASVLQEWNERHATNVIEAIETPNLALAFS